MTVARPAPTRTTACCQGIRSNAKKPPASRQTSRSSRGRGPARPSSKRARANRNGRAYRQRNSVAVDGDVPEKRKKMPEKARKQAPRRAAPRGDGRIRGG